MESRGLGLPRDIAGARARFAFLQQRFPRMCTSPAEKWLSSSGSLRSCVFAARVRLRSAENSTNKIGTLISFVDSSTSFPLALSINSFFV